MHNYFIPLMSSNEQIGKIVFTLDTLMLLTLLLNYLKTVFYLENYLKNIFYLEVNSHSRNALKGMHGEFDHIFSSIHYSQY